MRYLILLILILGIFVVVTPRVRTRVLGALLPASSQSDKVVQIKPVTITFVGDIMMDRGVRRSVEKNFGGDYSSLFVHTSYLREADIAFANLEGTATSEISPRTGSKFSFRMEPKSLDALKAAGVDIVSFANNHVGDYSSKGFTTTLENLRDRSMFYTGAGMKKEEVVSPQVFEVRGMKIGFLAASDVGPDWLFATDARPGMLLASDPHLSDIISHAKSQVDILVVSFHWGNEYSPKNAHQEALAHEAIDVGADIIVGHHPHVIESVEEYKGKPIFYSLGNFIFDQYFSVHTMHGLVAKISIDPTTKAITYTQEVSELSKQYVPQQLTPFDPSILITKRFTP